ncbi:uncharacterized protein [Vicugna pacos]|uniref:Uncharacterized protein n=1 Tax=Vicugna pacos TaxID=30538 RepID=A0ABM5DKK7_VICPA
MFCCVPTPRGRGARKARSQGLGQRCRRWLSSHPRRLWPFGHRDPKSRTLQEPLDQDTHAASPSEGPLHASQGQHQLRVSLHTEGSPPPRRPPPQKPPRRHARVLPAADRQLSRPGSDLEQLPASQVEDQEPTEAQPQVTDPEQARAGEDATDQNQDHQDPAGDPELPPAAPAASAAPATPTAPDDPAAPAIPQGGTPGSCPRLTGSSADPALTWSSSLRVRWRTRSPPRHSPKSQIQSRRGQGKMPQTKTRTIRIQQETPSSLLLLLQLLQLQQLTLLLKILQLLQLLPLQQLPLLLTILQLLLFLKVPQLLLLLKVPQLPLLPKVLKMLHLQLDRWATDSQFRRQQPLGMSPLCAHPHLLLQNPTVNPLPHPTMTSIPLK